MNIVLIHILPIIDEDQDDASLSLLSEPLDKSNIDGIEVGKMFCNL